MIEEMSIFYSQSNSGAQKYPFDCSLAIGIRNILHLIQVVKVVEQAASHSHSSRDQVKGPKILVSNSVAATAI